MDPSGRGVARAAAVPSGGAWKAGPGGNGAAAAVGPPEVVGAGEEDHPPSAAWGCRGD